MLTALDDELFSKDCEVVHVPSHDLRIYLIQKNASSSLRREAKKQQWTIDHNHEITCLSSIDVFLREPRERLASGINTFVQDLYRNRLDLDYATCEFMATKYLFLNRHYMPQWHWLVNLARWLHHDCEIRLHPLEDLKRVTAHRDRGLVHPITEHDKKRILAQCGDISVWMLLDEILIGRTGQSFTWAGLLDLYRQHPARPLDIISQPLWAITDVLR